MRSRLHSVAISASIVVLLVLVAGCANSTLTMDTAALSVADRYARAVYVDRDCLAAAATSYPKGGSLSDCADLRSQRWPFHIVRRSGRISSGCSFDTSLFLLPGSSTPQRGDCIIYHLIGLYRSSPYGRPLWQFVEGYERFSLDKIHGEWKVVASDYEGGGGGCGYDHPREDCRNQFALWQHRVPLHSNVPSLPGN
jgi:hypothetical protein